MKLIVGLGNIGAEYDNTRHNFGFRAVDYLAAQFDASWNTKPKFFAQIAKTTINDEKVLFIKPTTFYNSSGAAVRAIRDFYHLTNSDILVIHDEIALPIGTLRTRLDGQDAGNNGIKNLNLVIGEDFARIRVGSGEENGENGSTIPDAPRRDFVLSKLTKSDKEKSEKLLPQIENIVRDFVAGNFTETTHQV